MTCQHCGDRGAIRIAYQSGEPFDLALCDCRSGRVFRRAGEPFVRDYFRLTAAQQVSVREALDGEPVKAPAADFTAAGKTRPRAKL